jgi:hypothetical protein
MKISEATVSLARIQAPRLPTVKRTPRTDPGNWTITNLTGVTVGSKRPDHSTTRKLTLGCPF